jgi:hypothetical protein
MKCWRRLARARNRQTRGMTREAIWRRPLPISDAGLGSCPKYLPDLSRITPIPYPAQ